MIKRIIALMIAGIVLASPLVTEADDDLEYIRTTVYYAHEGAKTATGKEARYGIVAYKPEYFGKTCILYTEDMEYIGVFECEDTGGERVRTEQSRNGTQGERGKRMTIEFNAKRVANLLKHMVNNRCEDGFKWYKDVTDEMPTIYDINHAIEILENTETETLEVGND